MPQQTAFSAETVGEHRYRKVTHCIFDMDGTLLDSEVMYHQAIAQVCDKYRKEYGHQIKSQLQGCTDNHICDMVVSLLKLPISASEFEAQMIDILRKTLPGAPLKKGAARLLTHLHDYGIQMALATNSTEQSVRLHSAAKPTFFALFHHKVCVTDPQVDRGKPNPDIYLVAASRFPDKPKPKDCLVFEDSKTGVQAGILAGMQVVLVPDRKMKRDKTRLASIVLPSLLDFKPELFGLPPYDNPLHDLRHSFDK